MCFLAAKVDFQEHYPVFASYDIAMNDLFCKRTSFEMGIENTIL